MHYLTEKNLSIAKTRVSKFINETPIIRWPLICKTLQKDILIKHENYNPTSSFKIRGGINYLYELIKHKPKTKFVVTASTGNHGQSISLASNLIGLKSKIFMPKGISQNKINSIKGYGGEIIIKGDDFEDAVENAIEHSKLPNHHFIESFHPWLVGGVASYAFEIFKNSSFEKIDYIYVPIGLGSGCVGLITVRNLLGLKTKIIGVQSEGAPSYFLSYKSGKVVSTNHSKTIAEGLATRKPHKKAFEIIKNNVEDIITVSDDEIIESQKIILKNTRSVSEPAGAAALAGFIKTSKQNALSLFILTGGNISDNLLKSIVI